MLLVSLLPAQLHETKCEPIEKNILMGVCVRLQNGRLTL